jgi:hypothetical protein
VSDVYGDGRLRVTAQLVDAATDPAPEWAVTTTLRGDDYVAVARAKHGPEAGVSYCQRLAPGSPVTVGGELFVSGPALRQAGQVDSDAGAPPAPTQPAAEWAVGAAYDAGSHMTSAHVATTGVFVRVASLHHVVRPSDGTTLAAKIMYHPLRQTTMVRACGAKGAGGRRRGRRGRARLGRGG